MGRSRKDAPAVDGSGDPADLEEEEDVEVEPRQEEQEVGEEEEEQDGEDDGEEEEEHREEASGETVEQDKAVEGSPPKLAEGFFEIEAIRRRRRRRGQLQYLVKWRGWPESANTWEPLGNLKACPDFIDAFEKRSRPRSSRKRKRKTTTTPTTDPNPSRGKRGRPPRSEARSLLRPPAVPKILPCRTSSRRASNNSHRTPFGGLEASVNGLGRVLEEGSSGVVSEGFPSQGPPLSVSLAHQQDEHHPANPLPKVGYSVQAPPSQGGQVTGAKKRKSGCVRRFKLDEGTQQQGDHRDRTSEKPGNEYIDSTEGEIVDKNKGDEFGNQVHITSIIKPVHYFATIMDGVQQVSIIFRALRSDGEEVLVDNKLLKAKHPLVLIDYYERHLRYNPTS